MSSIVPVSAASMMPAAPYCSFSLCRRNAQVNSTVTAPVVDLRVEDPDIAGNFAMLLKLTKSQVPADDADAGRGACMRPAIFMHVTAVALLS